MAAGSLNRGSAAFAYRQGGSLSHSFFSTSPYPRKKIAPAAFALGRSSDRYPGMLQAACSLSRPSTRRVSSDIGACCARYRM